MSERDEWSLNQLKPQGMFEKANRWIDIIKILGAGNAAGASSGRGRHNLVRDETPNYF
jgi:hypothetical protein